MALQVKIKMDDRQVTKKLNTVTSGMKTMKEPFTDIGNKLLDFFGKKVFSTQGGAIGERWRGWSASTIEARLNRRGHYANSPISTNKILVWTGAMSKGFIKKVKRFSLEISNNVKYFRFNQKTRKMLAINKEVINIVIDGFEK